MSEVAGNLYQQGLPPLRGMQQIARDLASFPHHADAERALPHVQRRYAVLRLRQLFVPTARHVRMAEGIDMLMRAGYEGRDPAAWKFEARQRRLARSNILRAPASRPVGCEGGAGCGFLIGAPGMGKTQTVEQALRSYEQLIELPGLPAQVSWLKLECPDKGSIRSLCFQFFDELSRLVGKSDYTALFMHRRAGEDALMHQMALAANFHGLGLLVIDEIQHIGRVAGEEHQMMSFLTQLTNQLGIPVLFVGTLSILAHIQRTGRMARRSVGPACAIWKPLTRGSEWQSCLTRLWTYQWTQEPTELDDELVDIFFEETGGIIDLAVKLYIAVQLRLLYRSEMDAQADEIIRPNFVRGVARTDFAPVRPMVKALNTGDPAKLARFEDLHSFERNYWANMKALVGPSQIPVTATSTDLNHAADAEATGGLQMIISQLQREGIGDDIIFNLIDQIRHKGLDPDDNPFAFFAAAKDILRKAKRPKRPSAKLDVDALNDRDLRKLIEIAATKGLTPLEAISEAGLAGIWPEAAS
ncbi:hypothetical protein GCM10010990_36410 [Croceicoccus mobilis]|uniref:ORC1/DEAH AAA+ ATPase domain-containing protein n=2 Tax=Croceicoccus mobilis TaxID=1703339 RepID=A0A917E002_9SPHN|nr:hypothetical protein GCM10010990_36410 [Croceicoccus mobilis]